jgi:hypothetical protein
MPLQQTDNFQSISNWLNENLSDEKSFKPFAATIPNPRTNPSVSSKGIYLIEYT